MYIQRLSAIFFFFFASLLILLIHSTLHMPVTSRGLISDCLEQRERESFKGVDCGLLESLFLFLLPLLLCSLSGGCGLFVLLVFLRG